MSTLYNNTDIDAIFGSADSGKQVSVLVSSDVQCIIYCDGEEAFHIEPNIPKNLKCNIGKHIVSFVPAKYPNVAKSVNVEYYASGTALPVSVSLSKEVSVAADEERKFESRQSKAIAEMNKTAAKKRLAQEKKTAQQVIAREKEEKDAFLKKVHSGDVGFYMTGKERKWYEQWSRRKSDFEDAMVDIFFIMIAVFIVSLVAYIVGWINGNGHAAIWTWLFWLSIVGGLVSLILIEKD